MKNYCRILFFMILGVVFLFAGQVGAYRLDATSLHLYTYDADVTGNQGDDIEQTLANNDTPYILNLNTDLQYKDNYGGVEEGPLSGSYETTYALTARWDDGVVEEMAPTGATISYQGGDIITNPYLIVKDGNHDPLWYFFDLTTIWDSNSR